MQIIAFNGPPKSGKDSYAALIKEKAESLGISYGRYSFADEVKTGTHREFGLLYDNGTPFEASYYEEMKDDPLPEFGNRTPREAYIWYSEVRMKPVYGKDIFARKLVERLKHATESIVAITDVGFDEESGALCSNFPPYQVAFIRLYREGTSYEGDSRKYVKPIDGYDFFDVRATTLDETFQRVSKYVDWSKRNGKAQG